MSTPCIFNWIFIFRFDFILWKNYNFRRPLALRVTHTHLDTHNKLIWFFTNEFHVLKFWKKLTTMLQTRNDLLMTARSRRSSNNIYFFVKRNFQLCRVRCSKITTNSMNRSTHRAQHSTVSKFRWFLFYHQSSEQPQRQQQKTRKPK